MTNEIIRKRARLDFSDFDGFEAKPKPKPPTDVQKQIAESSGFTSRQNGEASQIPVDGRSLRATGRNVQMNIAVKAETKKEFWRLLQESGHTRAEELLVDLMEHWKSQST
jgi:hypothetical protein